MSTFTFHLIGNAHLDPVWLWDWREGLSEGIVTCRTILDLMDEDKELTFIRGESAIYQHIEQHDPQTFARIKKYVKQGRWDVVGGTVIQPDTNLPATETLARHLTHGLRYFADRFGKRVRVAWAADSFGHAEGLPEILAAAGIEGFAFTRPAQKILPIARPAFWWEGPGGSRVLAYRPNVGWYGCERHEMNRRLDGYLEEAKRAGLHNVGCFFGLGNHGGGPTRRHLDEIRAWAKEHRDVKLVFSGLHRLFDALRKEIARKPADFLPVHRGEMNFCLRGCYSSVAKFKFPYRGTEAQLTRAEGTATVIHSLNSGTGASPVRKTVRAHGRGAHATDELREAWESLLFNSFHDILPGTSIERAFDEQLAWLGGAYHAGQRAELGALTALGQLVDTRVAEPKQPDMPAGVAMLVWNPHPRAYTGPVELEASLDYRPIWAYHKRPHELPLRVTVNGESTPPFQVIDTEHSSMVDMPWRKRIVLPMNLPAMGWNVVEMAWDEDAPKAPAPGSRGLQGDAVISPEPGVIDNGIYRVTARPGAGGIQIQHHGRFIFTGEGLTAVTVEDPWGSWGGMAEEPESLDLSTIRHRWKIERFEMLETGPLRAKMWVRLVGGSSWLDLTFAVTKDRAAVDVAARVMWNERSARLKLIMPVGERAQYDVPGATVNRGPAGEVPGGRWVRVNGTSASFGFASDALYNFDTKDGTLRATICRATRYANDVKTSPQEQPFRPAVDAGELRFNFLVSPGDEHLPRLAEELERPPLAVMVAPAKGRLPRSGSLMALAPESIKLLALKPAADGRGVILRVQQTAAEDVTPQLTWLGKRVRLTPVKGHRIATWRLARSRGAWRATPVDVAEQTSRRTVRR